VAAKLRHPNLVEVFGAAEVDGLLHYRMERVEGESLAAHIESGGADPAIPDEAACRAWAGKFARVADALHLAHSVGIIHRDVKPSNLLVDPDGRLRLTDFGIARSEAGETLTATSAILGTPLYMAPEQAAGRSRDIGPGADLYALAATLYEVVAGRPPFDPAEGYAGILTRILHTPPRPPRRLNPALPRSLETVVLKCLEKTPGARYASAADLAADLDRVAGGQRVRARRVGLLRRLGRRARRQPALAVSLLGLAVSLVFLVFLVLGQGRSSYAESTSAQWIDLRRQAWLLLFAGPDLPALRAVDHKLRSWKPTTADESDEGHLLRAWVALKRKDFARALDILAAPETLRSEKAARLLRGFILRAQFRFKAARDEDRRAGDLEPRTRLDHGLQAFHLFRHRGERDKGLKEITDLVETCPDYLPARILLTEMHRTGGDTRRALEATGALLLMRPGDTTILTLRGRIYERARNREAAEKAYRAATKADPQNDEARIYLYYLLASKGPEGRKEAQTLLAEGLRIQPDSAWLHNAQGWQNQLDKNYQAALGHYRAALRADPHFQLSQFNLFDLLVKLHRDREALEVLAAMIADKTLPPLKAGNLLNHRAYYWWNHHDRAAAFRDIRRSLALCYRPRNHHTLIYFLIQEVRYGEALEELDRLLSLVPGDRMGLARRGKYRMLTYDLEGARSDCDRAVAAYGKALPTWVRHYRAQLAMALEDPETAEVRLEEAGKGLKNASDFLSWIHLKACFLMTRPGREAEVRKCIRTFRSQWKPLPKSDERPWMDATEVVFLGRQDGWKAAAKAWKDTSLPGKASGFSGGRFERLRHWITGARADTAGPYRDLCRALLEDRIDDVAALVARMPAPEDARRAWVAGAALLDAGREKEAVPHLEAAAKELECGLCELDLGLARAKVGLIKEAAGNLERALQKDFRHAYLVFRLHDLSIPPDPVLSAAFLKNLSGSDAHR